MKKLSRFKKITKQFNSHDIIFLNQNFYKIHKKIKYLNLKLLITLIFSFVILINASSPSSFYLLIIIIPFGFSFFYLLFSFTYIIDNFTYNRVYNSRMFWKYQYKLANNFSLKELKKIVNIFEILSENNIPLTDKNVAKLFEKDLAEIYDNHEINQINYEILKEEENLVQTNKQIINLRDKKDKVFKNNILNLIK